MTNFTTLGPRQPLPELGRTQPLTARVRDIPAAAWQGSLPDGFQVDRIVYLQLGALAGPNIVVAKHAGRPRPPATKCRQLQRWRAGQSNTVVVGAIKSDEGWWVQGPGLDGDPMGPLTEERTQSILNEALLEDSIPAFRDRLVALLAAGVRGPRAGLNNQGLFATHYLTRVLPDDHAWPEATKQASAWTSMRDERLLGAMGFTVQNISGDGGVKLLVDASEPVRKRAIAVLLRGSDSFEGSSARFRESPTAKGLAVAQRHELEWLMVLRGSQIRLYAARPGVGVGSRGLGDTYLELDLAILSADNAAYLHYAFSASALARDGTVKRVIEESRRYAAALGSRLRQRVYEKAIPEFAVPVANAIERRCGEVDLDHAYRVALRILFRVLFQAYAEDRDLLPYRRNAQYDRYALKERAQERARGTPLGKRSTALWNDLKTVWAAIDEGNDAWGLPAYNGGLFGSDPELHPEGATISRIELTDEEVGGLLGGLLVDVTPDGVQGPVDFREMSVREFGTIYEGLLESSLSRADQNLALDRKGAYLPTASSADADVPAGTVYFHNTAGERKASGTYFTPGWVVKHLLERAVDPALKEHLAEVGAALDRGDDADASDSFFDFRVADIAMGSGHFLVGAIDHIESKMSAFLAERPVPSVTNELSRLKSVALRRLGNAADPSVLDPSSLLRRQIARRCVYGVDQNALAVDLARVAVWLHTFVPGLPMSSLDHNLVAADSLTGIGTIEDALASLEPDSQAGQLSLFATAIRDTMEESAEMLAEAGRIAEANKREVLRNERKYRLAREAAAPARLLFDLAVAKQVVAPRDVPEADDPETALEVAQSEVVRELVEFLKPGHFPDMFPEVFVRENPGFDVLVGNPPWEKVKVETHSWFGTYLPGLQGLPVGRMNRKIKDIRKQRPDLEATFEADKRVRRRMANALNRLFPNLGSGDTDLYAAFAWRYWQLARSSGRLGVVLPRTALSGAGMAKWRRALLAEGTFTDVVTLVNTDQWVFDSITPQYTTGLVAARKGAGTTDTGGRVIESIRGPYHSRDEMARGMDEKPVAVPVEDFLSWSASAMFPSVPSVQSLDILSKMMHLRRLNTISDTERTPNGHRTDTERTPNGHRRWSARPAVELHASQDRHRFVLDGGALARSASSTRPETASGSRSTQEGRP